MKRFIPLFLLFVVVSVTLFLVAQRPEVIHSSDVATSSTATPDRDAAQTPEQHSHSQSHDHDHDQSPSAFDTLPPELQAYIHSQRKPAGDLPVVHHGNGRSTVYSEGQWSTVVMAVIDEDGTHRTLEQRIDPIGTLELEMQQ